MKDRSAWDLFEHTHTNVLLHLGRVLLHWPLDWQRDMREPCRTKPVLHTKRTTSLRLNCVPWVTPKEGFPGWPQVMATKTKKYTVLISKFKNYSITLSNSKQHFTTLKSGKDMDKQNSLSSLYRLHFRGPQPPLPPTAIGHFEPCILHRNSCSTY